MQYVEVAEAKDKQGLRLALTMGVPGPWSQAAKLMFQVKGIPFIPVGQAGGRANDALYEWTGYRNAPIAVYNDEPPRVGWHEIIMLAERIKSEPALVPTDSTARVELFGIIAEVAAENGLAWQRRFQMIGAMYASEDDGRMHRLAEVLAGRYGYTPEAVARSAERCADILRMLAAKLKQQEAGGSQYFVGKGFSAADLYWACFSQLIDPMAEDINPMPAPLRAAYKTTDPVVTEAIDPILLSHRGMMYERHLGLPLDF